MAKFIIDTPTKGKTALINKLKRLKSTISVEDGGEYHADNIYSQVHIDTTMTQEKLEDWLWRTKGIDYIGVCEDE